MEKLKSELPALSQAPQPSPEAPYDGYWSISFTSRNCTNKGGKFGIVIEKGKVTSKVASGGTGTVAQSGEIRWTQGAAYDSHPINFEGRFTGDQASGTFSRADRKCGGQFTASRT